MRTIMVLPTWNEAASLESLVARLRATAPDVDILIVDDSSPDGTGQIAERLAVADAGVHVLHRARKEGLGAAYAEGFREALARGYAAIGEMDADGSHDPADLHLLRAALTEADLVIGTRWMPGGSVRDWSWPRRQLSRWGNRYARLATGLALADATSGYRLYRAAALASVGFEGVQAGGYAFQVEMAHRFHDAGMRIRQVPITFVDRVHGESKMTPAIAWESMRLITKWGIARRLRPNRRS